MTQPGLCLTCQFARRIRSAKGSEFWLCRRAEAEPTLYAKYPRLPVLRCSGFEAALV
ncbi:MAG: hypothetical protein QM756_32215 [Polyangiaceae bacterium]